MPVNIILDATMLDTFQSCECKFNYRFNFNKVPLLTPKPLDQGGLAHIGAEVYYKELQKKTPFKERIEASDTAINESWSKDSEIPYEDCVEIQRNLNQSFEKWQYEDESMEILAVETPFAYQLFSDDEINVIMMGKIDLLVNWFFNGTQYKNLPIDHKTYSRKREYRRMANQFSNYAYACSSNYLFVNKIGLQTSLKPVDKHIRTPLSYDEFYLKQWRDDTVKWCRRYLDCVMNNSWPLNRTSCDKFNRDCEYLPVCDSSGEESKVFKLTAMFKDTEPWDVSQSLGKRNV